MLNPIKAFKDVNSAIQNVTGYSFSLSNIPRNINKIAFPAIALANGIYVAASEEDSPIIEGHIVICGQDCIIGSNYYECIDSCEEICIKCSKDFFDQFSKCVRTCIAYFSSE